MRETFQIWSLKWRSDGLVTKKTYTIRNKMLTISKTSWLICQSDSCRNVTMKEWLAPKKCKVGHNHQSKALHRKTKQLSRRYSNNIWTNWEMFNRYNPIAFIVSWKHLREKKHVIWKNSENIRVIKKHVSLYVEIL